MFLPRWLRQLAQQWSPSGGNSRRRAGLVLIPSRLHVRPCLELLEDRCLPTATITDLGAVGAGGTPEAINDAGQVVGVLHTASGAQHAFLYSNGKINDLGTLPGDNYSAALAINNSGQVVGVSGLTDSNGIEREHAFLYSIDQHGIGHMTELGALAGDVASRAYGINDAGVVVGVSEQVPGAFELNNGDYHAFLYSNGQMNPLGRTLGGNDSGARAINDDGQVVGLAQTSNGNEHAFLYSKDQNGNPQMKDLGTLGGTFSEATAISSSGQVVGSSWTSNGDVHAFLYSKDQNGNPQMKDLGTLGGNSSQAYGINDQEVVVGDSTEPNTSPPIHTPFIDINDQTYSQMYGLGTLAPPNSNWEIFYAPAINDNGQIAGFGFYEGVASGFLLNLYPQPQVTPTSLTWDKTKGGVDLSYQVSDAILTKDVPIAFYWATGSDISTIIDPNNPVYTYNVSAGTNPQAQAYGPIPIDGTKLKGVPANATYLLAVAEPGGNLASADPSLNVTSMRLALTLPSVFFQGQPPWGGNNLGRSTEETIKDYGCMLTDLSMQLSYSGITTDPGILNNELRNTPGFVDSGDGQNDALSPVIATDIIARDFNQPQIYYQLTTTSDPQKLRDLLISAAAPILVQVTNAVTGHFPHYVLVTGLSGNGDFIVSDPGYQYSPGPFTKLSSYTTSPTWFTTIGYVKDPPNVGVLDISVSSEGSSSSFNISDSQGHVTGINSSGEGVNEIPNSGSFVEAPLENVNGPSDNNTTVQFVAIYQPNTGSYTINLGGASSQPYVLNLNYVKPDGSIQSQQTITVPATGSPMQYQVDLGSTVTTPPPFIQLSNGPTNVAGQLLIGTVGVAYNQTISASDGSGALTMSYQIINGIISTGLNFNINGNALTISGTPTTGGNVNFIVTASDGNGDQTALNYSLTVNAPPPSPPLLPPRLPVLHIPPLLAFFDSLLGGIERINANNTETIVDSFFGFPLLVALFNHSGNLVSVDLFGTIDVTFLFG